NCQTIGSNDVALHSVFIFQQGQAVGPARIIFDRGDFGFHAVLVAFEIDQPNFLLVSTSDSAACDAAIAVAPAGFLANLDQVLFRFTLGNLVKRRNRDIARRWRKGSKAFYWHNKFLSQNDLVSFLE